MKKYVLFDNDGVLVDTEPWYYAAGERALGSIGLTLDRDRYVREMSRGGNTWAEAEERGVDAATIERLRTMRDAYYQEYLRTEPIEIGGVTDVLAQLSGHVRMAIVTTARGEDFELIHAHREICRYMEFVLVREDYARAKPDPEPYLTALARFGARRGEALVVEDSSRGLAAAVAAGIDCAVVDNAFTAAQDFSQATCRIRSLAELKDVILGRTA